MHTHPPPPKHTPVSVVSLPVFARVTSAHSVRSPHPEYVVSHAHGEPAVPLNEIDDTLSTGITIMPATIVPLMNGTISQSSRGGINS